MVNCNFSNHSNIAMIDHSYPKSTIISLFTARSYRSHSGKVELSNCFRRLWRYLEVHASEPQRSRPGMLNMWCFLVLLS